MQGKMLTNGELVDGFGEALDVLNPATGDSIGAVNAANSEQIDAATRSAAEAFDACARTTPAERAAVSLQIADVIDACSHELAELQSLDAGKPWSSVHADEMRLTINVFRFFAGAARTMMGSAAGEYVAGHTPMIRRDPVGPATAIALWNCPLMMASWKLAALIAAGCTVILKPSELTPLSTLRLAELLQDVLPKGVLNVIQGRGPSVGDVMFNSLQMEAITDTRSPAIGMAAMRAASRQFRHVHVELGGKAPLIVFEDADLDAVAETIRYGSFLKADQDCAQPCRVLVADRAHDKLVAAIQNQVSQTKIGAPKADGTEMRPLLSAAQHDCIASFMDQARGAGEIVSGRAAGQASGFFYQPTVIANVDNKAEIAFNEVFAPAITVFLFSDTEEALMVANKGTHGLASSIWTSDVGPTMQMTAKLRYGLTWVNTHGVATTEMPWAATKGSGVGCDMSVFALDACTAIRHVMVAH